MTERVWHSEIGGPLAGTDEDFAKHQSLYAAGLTWKPSPAETVSFQSRFFASRAEADEASARILSAMGYREPRWHEYWRWGEMRPSENVLQKLTQAKP